MFGRSHFDGKFLVWTFPIDVLKLQVGEVCNFRSHSQEEHGFGSVMGCFSVVLMSWIYPPTKDAGLGWDSCDGVFRFRILDGWDVDPSYVSYPLAKMGPAEHKKFTSLNENFGHHFEKKTPAVVGFQMVQMVSYMNHLYIANWMIIRY